MDQGINEQKPNSPMVTTPVVETPQVGVSTNSTTEQKLSFMGRLGDALGFGMLSPKTTENQNTSSQKPTIPAAPISSETAATAAWEGNPGAHPEPTFTNQNMPVNSGSESSDHPHSFSADSHAEPLPTTTDTTAAPQTESTSEPMPAIEPIQADSPETQPTLSAAPTIPELTETSSETLDTPTDSGITTELPSDTPTVSIDPLPSITPDARSNFYSPSENMTSQIPEQSIQKPPTELSSTPIAAPDITLMSETPTLEPTSTSTNNNELPSKGPVETPATTESASFGENVDAVNPFADISIQQPTITPQTPTVTPLTETTTPEFPTKQPLSNSINETAPILTTPDLSGNTITEEPAPTTAIPPVEIKYS